VCLYILKSHELLLRHFYLGALQQTCSAGDDRHRPLDEFNLTNQFRLNPPIFFHLFPPSTPRPIAKLFFQAEAGFIEPMQCNRLHLARVKPQKNGLMWESSTYRSEKDRPKNLSESLK